MRARWKPASRVIHQILWQDAQLACLPVSPLKTLWGEAHEKYCNRQEQPRESEDSEFSQPTATVKGLFLSNRGGSRGIGRTRGTQTLRLRVSLGFSFKFLQMNKGEEKERTTEKNGFPRFSGNS